MRKTKIVLCLILLSYLPWSFNSMIAASDDSKIDKKVELWETSTRKIEELLPIEERPKKGAIVIAYYPDKNEGIIYFMYEERTIKISILKENETDYVLKYKDKTLIGYREELKGGKIACIYLFLNKQEKNKKLFSRTKGNERDVIYRRSSKETVEEMLERMRDEAKFAEEEQNAFEKDPPNMMKGGE